MTEKMKRIFGKEEKIDSKGEQKNRDLKIVENFNKFLYRIFKKAFSRDQKINLGINQKKERKYYRDPFFNFLERIISEYYQPILNFVIENNSKLKNNYYDVIIGDDVKGRLPTLVLREILNYYRAKNNLPSVEVKFVSGGREHLWTSEKFKNIVNYLEKLNLKNKKILLVTEFALGKGVLKLANVFKQLKLDFDCFVAFSKFKKKYYLNLGKGVLQKDNLFIGLEKDNAPDTDLYYLALGLRKGERNSALAKKEEIIFPYYVQFTRKRIKELASEIIEAVENFEEK